jgi:hypothetical protein
MLEHFRTQDAQLLAQLAHITGSLSRSAVLLVRLLEGPAEAAGGIAAEARALRAPTEDGQAGGMDVHHFTAFAMRLDPSGYRDVAVSLDEAVSSVGHAIGIAAALHVGAADVRVLALARALAGATRALGHAVPHVGEGPDAIRRTCAEVWRLADAGRAIHDEAMGALLASTTDAVEVIRAKEILDVLQRALGCCADTALVLERLHLSP